MEDISLNQIISIIGSLKKPHTFSVESEPNFLQPLSIPENVIQENESLVDVSCGTSSTHCDNNAIIYEEHGVMTIPQSFFGVLGSQ